MFHQLHHVAIIVSDYPQSKHFYTQILGLPIIQETYREDRGSYKLDLALSPHTQLEVFSFPSPPPRPSYPEACGLRHLAFEVENIQATIDHLAQHKVQCEPVRIDELTGKAFTFFADPDRLPIEIYQA